MAPKSKTDGARLEEDLENMYTQEGEESEEEEAEEEDDK